MTALFSKPARRAAMRPASEAFTLLAGHGIVGDCHASPFGPRQVLLVAQETLDELGLSAAQLRANVVVAGLPLEDLQSGTVLALGPAARIRLTHRCEVCQILRRYVTRETFKRLPGRRGYLGVVLRSGSVRAGDPVRPESRSFPPVPEAIDRRAAWVVERIPSGFVMTYDALLAAVGSSRSYFRVLPTYLDRAAAWGAPAHRVLTTHGGLQRHMPDQAARLRSEGIAVEPDGTVRGQRWVGRGLYVAR